MSDLTHDSSAYINGELKISPDKEFYEKRILELVLLLEEEKHFTTKSNSQLEEMKKEIESLRTSNYLEQNTLNDKWKKDYAGLKEQIQSQIQTTAILVSDLSQSKRAYAEVLELAENKEHEVEELAGRLSGSRHRIAELDRYLANLNKSNIKLEKTNKELSKELDSLKLDIYKNKKSREELKQHNFELENNFQLKIDEVAKLKDELIEIKGKFEMVQLQLHQFQNIHGNLEDTSTIHMEEILTEKTELLAKVHLLEESLKSFERERDIQMQQHNQIIDKLQHFNNEATDQINRVIEERDLEIKLRRDLEDALENLQNMQVEVQVHENNKEILQLLERLKEVNLQYEDLYRAFSKINSDKKQLEKILEDKENKISKLEILTKQFQVTEAEQADILYDINPDKISLSEVLELQERNAKLTMENFEMTKLLQADQQNLKELEIKAIFLEEEKNSLKELLSLKEKKLSDSLQTLSILEEQKLNTNELQKDTLAEEYEQKLHSTQDAIIKLTHQNNELQYQISKIEEKSASNATFSIQIKDPTSQLSQMESECDNSINQQESQKLLDHIKEKPLDMQQNLSTSDLTMKNDNFNYKMQFDDLKNSMFQLEEKYKKIIEDKIKLMELTDQQEHIILQLQNENETIGEYVSLYQQQRTILHKRSTEKDTYIFQMQDKQTEMEKKLIQLQMHLSELLYKRQFTNDNNNTISLVNDNVELPNTIESEEVLDSSPNLNSKFPNLNQESSTIRQIMDFLTKMEGSGDHIIPCSHCHGQLAIV